MGKVCCFTGHRPKGLYGYDKQKYYPLFHKLEEVILLAIEQGYDTFISGGAQGLDQIAFCVVNKIKRTNPSIRNIIYVPFKGQEDRWSETGLFSKQSYRNLLNLADEVKYLKDVDKNNFKQVVNALMYRNHKMCDDSDLVIGVSTSDYKNKNKGGTFECLNYAKSLGLPIILIDIPSLKIKISQP